MKYTWIRIGRSSVSVFLSIFNDILDLVIRENCIVDIMTDMMLLVFLVTNLYISIYVFIWKNKQVVIISSCPPVILHEFVYVIRDLFRYDKCFQFARQTIYSTLSHDSANMNAVEPLECCKLVLVITQLDPFDDVCNSLVTLGMVIVPNDHM